MNGIFYKGETLSIDLKLTDDSGNPIDNVKSVELILVSSCNGGKSDKHTATYDKTTGKVSTTISVEETKRLEHETWLEIRVTLTDNTVRIGTECIGNCLINKIYTL